MRVFVTGASGFIGAHVTRALLTRGHEVAVLARPADTLQRLESVRRDVRILSGTLADTEALQKPLCAFQPEACIHLAWYAEPGKYLHAVENLQLLSGSLLLFGEVIRAGCRRIAAAGTCFEYDASFGYLKEDTPTRPGSLYAAAKLSCGLTGQQIAARANVRFAWGRIFYPYGPQEDERRLISSAVQALALGVPFLTTGGEQIRDYIHVQDIARAFCTLIEHPADGVFNISSGAPISIRQLLTTIGRLTDRLSLIRFGALPYREGDPPFICGDNRRLRGLGWSPQCSLEQGLPELVQSAFRQAHESQTPVSTEAGQGSLGPVASTA